MLRLPSNFFLAATSLVAACLLTSAACGDPDDTQTTSTEVIFETTINGAPFSCSETYSDLGTSAATAEIHDFRFYVHDFELVDAQGNIASAEIVEDGKWQRKEVALIDFTDGTGNCENSPSEKNNRVDLLIPEGDWTGLRFRLGVPQEVNHIDVSTAAAPLSIPSMFWGWTGGYKFMRLDMPTENNPSYRFHLGSMQCEPTPGENSGECDYPNRPQIVVEEFRFGDDFLRLDLADLLATTDLNHNTEDTPHGCMSTVDDPDCDAIFQTLGLPGEDAISTLFQPVAIEQDTQ